MPVTLKVLHCTLLFKGRTSYNSETCAPMCIYIPQPIYNVLLSHRYCPLARTKWILLILTHFHHDHNSGFYTNEAEEKSNEVVSHWRPSIGTLTAPKGTDDALCDGIKGPSLQLATVRVRPMDITQCNPNPDKQRLSWRDTYLRLLWATIWTLLFGAFLIRNQVSAIHCLFYSQQ